MTAHILVVDDEPDVEALILQKFRHKIRDGAIRFLFARDGVEALAVLKANGQIDLVVTDIIRRPSPNWKHAPLMRLRVSQRMLASSQSINLPASTSSGS